MKVLAISTDRKIFEPGSSVRERQIQYGKIFDELHLVVFTTKAMSFGSNIKLSENVFVYPTNSRSKLFYVWDSFWIGKALSSKFKDKSLVISTQDPFETGLVGFLLKIFRRLPLQVQVHTDFTNRYFIFHSWLNFVRFPLGLFVLSFSDSVRVVSERISRSVHSLSHNISVLPIYTELRAKSLELEVEKKEKADINFLTVCRLEKEKDLETAIYAFKKVLDKGISAVFTIVGDGSERKGLELLAKSLEPGNKIRFVGWQNDLDKYYQDADVYVSTSLYEGYGMSVVEAASFGLALVISDTGVAGDLFRDGEEALVCEQKNIDQFSAAILKLVSDKKLRLQLGQSAQMAAAENGIDFGKYLEKYKNSIDRAEFSANSKDGIFKKNILLRYLVAGFTGASTQIGTLYIFTDIIEMWYLYSSIVSFLFAIAVSFILQKFWTFGDRKTDQIHNQFVKYMATAILGLLINTVLMYALVDVLSIWYIFAQIIIGAFIAIFNFLMYKFFIFTR